MKYLNPLKVYCSRSLNFLADVYRLKNSIYQKKVYIGLTTLMHVINIACVRKQT